MNDSDVLTLMRSSLTSTKDALTHVHLNEPAEAIVARARARRLRRSLPGVAGALTIGTALATLSLTGGQAVPPGSPNAAGGADGSGVHVNLAAWSVNTSPTGLVDVTIRQLKDPAGLTATLADAGVPVVLTTGRVCASDDHRAVEQVVRKVSVDGDLAMTIDPQAMPPGTELVIGVGTLRSSSGEEPGAAFGLEQKGSPLSCPAGTKTAVK